VATRRLSGGDAVRLNLISHWEGWRERIDVLKKDALNIPTSVPAFLSLEAEGVPFTTASGFLLPEDYQIVWEESAQLVDRMVDLSSRSEVPGVSSVFAIHAYSLFLLVAQVRILRRSLEAAFQCHNFDGVTMEAPEDQNEEQTLYFDAVHSPYFHDVARQWAREKGLTLSLVRAGPIQEIPRERRRWRVRTIEVACLGRAKVRAAFRGGWWALKTAVRRVLYRLSGGPFALFYLPQKGAGLDGDSPGWAIDVSSRFKAFRRFATTQGGGAGETAAVREAARLVLLGLGPGDSGIVSSRLTRHLGRTWNEGLSVLSGFRHYLKGLITRGKKPAFVAAAPFVDWTFHGYVAEAFRAEALPVAGVQHGGNYGLTERGGLPIPFIEGVGGLFFHWGTGRADELAGYRVSVPMRWVQTGSPRMEDLRGRRRRFRSGVGFSPRVLYAPTLVGMVTAMGSNVPWDVYIPFCRAACRLLNDSGLEVWVKVLNTPEMEHLRLDRFPNLSVLKRGGFADYMEYADILIVDSLGGSPIYESLATEKPILLYGGIERQRWALPFLKRLEERVHCFWDAPSCLAGLRNFATDPESFLKRGAKTDGAGLFADYFSPVGKKTFWETVRSETYKENGPHR
jgi:hypothetical protein